jgi:hypothetical protein
MISAPGTLPEHPYFRCKYSDYFVIPNHHVIPLTCLPVRIAETGINQAFSFPFEGKTTVWE